MRARLLRRRDDPDPARTGGRLSFYGADLARVHDEGFGDHPRAAATALLARLDRPALVVELGCGTGITSALLVAAGCQVVGVDLSEDMLAIARRNAPGAEFRQGSIWDVPLPACNAVTAIGEVINYAADPRAGVEQLPGLFTRIHEALRPGGIFMFDFATPGRGSLSVRGEREGPGWQIEFSAGEEPDARVLERSMKLTVDGRETRETHMLRLYDGHAVSDQLSAAGFEVEALNGYGSRPFPWPGYAALAASKPASPAR